MNAVWNNLAFYEAKGFVVSIELSETLGFQKPQWSVSYARQNHGIDNYNKPLENLHLKLRIFSYIP
ncbi:MAG: hypothetical protein ACI94Y_002555 [Maribacter sp.]|jgi:hypothetical protein